MLHGMCNEGLQQIIGIEWINCHDHAAVNTLGAMGAEINAEIVDAIGDDMHRLAAIAAGRKVYDADKEKYHTNIWMMRSPLNNYIYRFQAFFAEMSIKHWAKGKSFIEIMLACDDAQDDPILKLSDGERWVLEGMMRIVGSKNGAWRSFHYPLHTLRLTRHRGGMHCARVNAASCDGGWGARTV